MSNFDILDVGTMALGECPVWSVREQALYWIDIENRRLFRLDPASGAQVSWAMPATIGSFALGRGGRMLLALRTGFVRFDTSSGDITPVGPRLDYDPGTHRLNDGRCDRAGRFWVGSINETKSAADAKLYRLDGASMRLSSMEEHGITIANGLAFSPDDRTLYFADTVQHRVWAYDFDLASGSIRNQRLFIQTSQTQGRPDGAAVDADGGYWICVHGKVLRYSPEGRLDREVELPAMRLTMCAFGGSHLDTLYVTSMADYPNVAPDPTKPHAGRLFAVDIGTAGMPEPEFAWPA